MPEQDLEGRPDPYLPPGLNRPNIALPGVATVALPKYQISGDLQRQVQLELDKLDPGTHTAVLNIHSKTGVNLVLASKVNEHLTATMWLGKSGWDSPIREGWEGAVSLRASWGAGTPKQGTLL